MKLTIIVLLTISAVIAERVCKPRSQFNDYCNICTCSNDGLSFGCTRMTCDKAMWNPDGSFKDTSKNNIHSKLAVKTCKPRSHFKNYCNNCACSDDGLSFICTRMMCDEQIWNEDGTLKVISSSHRIKRSVSEDKKVCKPRSQFKDYCNICSCSHDGLSFGCTRMMCNKKIWNPDGTLKDISKNQRGTTSGNEKVCEPLLQFNEYCNTCLCSDDGLSYSCTEKVCDKETWNQDETGKSIIIKDELRKSLLIL